MSQDWVADLYTTGTVGDTTLSNMELMFATLRSSFSGSAAPSSPVNGNLWYDTDTNLLKLYRNAAWAGVLVGSTSLKTWIYRNTAEDGWAIDAATATDRVLALKGGTLAYNVAGGTNAGSWTLSGISVATHGDHTHSMQGHVHYLALQSVTSVEVIAGGFIRMTSNLLTEPGYEGGASSSYKVYYYTGGPSTGSTAAESPDLTHTPSHNGNDRPAAAVGTLQYPNVSG